ncbi:MAG: 50S ribosomal protein L25 [Planctomycetota bacterium]
MSDTITLEAEKRDKLGTRECRRIRKAGKIPAVVYGHGEGNTSLALPTKLTTESIAKGAHLFNLDIAGSTESVLLKDIQFDPFGVDILHLDFARISLDEVVTVLVPLHYVGDAKGEKEGGVVAQEHTEVEVECRADSIPDEIKADISGLGLSDNLQVSDLTLPAGVTSTMDPDTVLVHVAPPRVIAVDDEPTAADGEPEVMGQTDDAAEGESKDGE